MKTVIINLSGNTGKTTLTKQMFTPLLGATRSSIEDTNAGDGASDVEISANKFKQLAAEINTAADDEHFVVDVGASNAKAMIAKFDSLTSTTELIDCWIIPVTPSAKQIVDSLRTATALAELGIDPSKIVLLPNNITDLESYDTDFQQIHKVRKGKFIVPDDGILSSEAFALLRDDERSIFDVVNNKPDFSAKKKELREAGDEKGLLKLGHEMVLYDLSRQATKNVQSVFYSLPFFKDLKEQQNG